MKHTNLNNFSHFYFITRNVSCRIFILAIRNTYKAANTFSQIYLQFVFAGKGRQCLIARENKEELHRYITGLVQKRKAKMLAVNSMPHHIHLFVGFRPVLSISDFVKEVKVESNEFITKKNGYSISLNGTMDMVFFPIHIHNRQSGEVRFEPGGASSKKDFS